MSFLDLIQMHKFGITLSDTYGFNAGRCELLKAFMFLVNF